MKCLDDKYIPWLILPVVLSLGILGFLLYLKIMSETRSSEPPFQPPPEQFPAVLRALESIDTNISNQIPGGEHEIRMVNANGSIYELYNEATNGLNWMSVQICNNGPNSVYYSINNWENPESPIVPGQCQSINLMRQEAIKKIFFKCDAGEAASVSVYGMK